MRRLSIRWRLTLWYGIVLSAILIGFSVAVYLLMQRHLLSLTEAAMREELDEVADEVKRATSLSELPELLKLRFPGHEGYELQVDTVAGKHLFRSAGVRSGGLPGCDIERVSTSGTVYENAILEELGPVRLGSRLVPAASGQLLIQVAVTLTPNARALEELMTVLLTIGPLALFCALGGGYWLARKRLPRSIRWLPR